MEGVVCMQRMALIYSLRSLPEREPLRNGYRWIKCTHLASELGKFVTYHSRRVPLLLGEQLRQYTGRRKSRIRQIIVNEDRGAILDSKLHSGREKEVILLSARQETVNPPQKLGANRLSPAYDRSHLLFQRGPQMIPILRALIPSRRSSRFN